MGRGAHLKITGVPMGKHVLDAHHFQPYSHVPWKHPHSPGSRPCEIVIEGEKTYYYGFANHVTPPFAYNGPASMQVHEGEKHKQEEHAALLAGIYKYDEIMAGHSSEPVHVMKHSDDPSKAVLVLINYPDGAVAKLWAAAHGVVELDINGKRVPKLLGDHEGVRVSVAPGDIVIDSHDLDNKMVPVENRKKTHKIHAEAGHTYFLNAKTSGVFRMHFEMVECKPEKAEHCKIVDIVLE